LLIVCALTANKIDNIRDCLSILFEPLFVRPRFGSLPEFLTTSRLFWALRRLDECINDCADLEPNMRIGYLCIIALVQGNNRWKLSSKAGEVRSRRVSRPIVLFVVVSTPVENSAFRRSKIPPPLGGEGLQFQPVGANMKPGW
jgi:hypothetical protein